MRLLTYNIHKGVGSDRRYKLDRVIEVIRDQAPDLICLQEVDFNVRRSHFQRPPGTNLHFEALPADVRKHRHRD